MSLYDDNWQWLFEDDRPEGVEVHHGVNDYETVNLGGTYKTTFTTYTPEGVTVEEIEVPRKATRRRKDWAEIANYCPVWGDAIPWKSITAIVPAHLVNDAENTLMDLHGGMASRRKTLPDGRVAIRSDYQAW